MMVTTTEHCSDHHMSRSQDLSGSSMLKEALQSVLPKDIHFRFYHISTPPEKSEPLTSPPSGHSAQKTYRECHFLSITIQSEQGEVLAFAIEVFIYSTTTTSTFFVSKADSTGYLALASCPRGTSPIKDVSTTFLSHLVKTHSREDVKHVVSLFARAQDQYLFPGSIDNAAKHVLDDRGLVRWWSKVLDPIVKSELFSSTIEAYLLVPGLDKYETMALLPKDKSKWSIGHPLEGIFGQNLSPRCIIPRFPDDPKARYLSELDDEIQHPTNDTWKSIKTMAQFWDMMAFRQECSAGRMVGFIWVVLIPPKSCTQKPSSALPLVTDGLRSEIASNPIKADMLEADTALPDHQSTKQQDSGYSSQPVRAVNNDSIARRSKKKLQGPIHARNPRIKTATDINKHKYDILERTQHYRWSEIGKGECVVLEKEYKRITELLLRLDFSDVHLAVSSSGKWISEVSSSWGIEVVGRKVHASPPTSVSDVQSMSANLVRKKRKTDVDASNKPVSNATPVVNILGANMIKKKPKKT